MQQARPRLFPRQRVQRLLATRNYNGIVPEVQVEGPFIEMGDNGQPLRQVFLAITTGELVIVKQDCDYSPLKITQGDHIDILGLELDYVVPLYGLKFFILDDRARRFTVATGQNKVLYFEMCQLDVTSDDIWCQWRDTMKAVGAGKNQDFGMKTWTTQATNLGRKMQIDITDKHIGDSNSLSRYYMHHPHSFYEVNSIAIQTGDDRSVVNTDSSTSVTRQYQSKPIARHVEKSESVNNLRNKKLVKTFTNWAEKNQEKLMNSYKGPKKSPQKSPICTPESPKTTSINRHRRGRPLRVLDRERSTAIVNQQVVKRRSVMEQLHDILIPCEQLEVDGFDAGRSCSTQPCISEHPEGIRRRARSKHSVNAVKRAAKASARASDRAEKCTPQKIGKKKECPVSKAMHFFQNLQEDEQPNEPSTSTQKPPLIVAKSSMSEKYDIEHELQMARRVVDCVCEAKDLSEELEAAATENKNRTKQQNSKTSITAVSPTLAKCKQSRSAEKTQTNPPISKQTHSNPDLYNEIDAASRESSTPNESPTFKPKANETDSETDPQKSHVFDQLSDLGHIVPTETCDVYHTSVCTNDLKLVKRNLKPIRTRALEPPLTAPTRLEPLSADLMSGTVPPAPKPPTFGAYYALIDPIERPFYVTEEETEATDCGPNLGDKIEMLESGSLFVYTAPAINAANTQDKVQARIPEIQHSALNLVKREAITKAPSQELSVREVRTKKSDLNVGVVLREPQPLTDHDELHMQANITVSGDKEGQGPEIKISAVKIDMKVSKQSKSSTAVAINGIDCHIDEHHIGRNGECRPQLPAANACGPAIVEIDSNLDQRFDHEDYASPELDAPFLKTKTSSTSNKTRSVTKTDSNRFGSDTNLTEPQSRVHIQQPDNSGRVQITESVVRVDKPAIRYPIQDVLNEGPLDLSMTGYMPKRMVSNLGERFADEDSDPLNEVAVLLQKDWDSFNEGKTSMEITTHRQEPETVRIIQPDSNLDRRFMEENSSEPMDLRYSRMITITNASVIRSKELPVQMFLDRKSDVPPECKAPRPTPRMPAICDRYLAGLGRGSAREDAATPGIEAVHLLDNFCRDYEKDAKCRIEVSEEPKPDTQDDLRLFPKRGSPKQPRSRRSPRRGQEKDENTKPMSPQTSPRPVIEYHAPTANEISPPAKHVIDYSAHMNRHQAAVSAVASPGKRITSMRETTQKSKSWCIPDTPCRKVEQSEADDGNNRQPENVQSDIIGSKQTSVALGKVVEKDDDIESVDDLSVSDEDVNVMQSFVEKTQSFVEKTQSFVGKTQSFVEKIPKTDSGHGSSNSTLTIDDFDVSPSFTSDCRPGSHTRLLQETMSRTNTEVKKITKEAYKRRLTKVDTVMDMRSPDLTKQLAAISRKLLLAVSVTDLQNYTSSQGRQIPDSISALIAYEEEISAMVTAKVLKNYRQDDFSMLNFFIQVCSDLVYKHHELESHVAILKGLTSAPLYKLNNMWQRFSERDNDNYNTLLGMLPMLSPGKRYIAYSQLVAYTMKNNGPMIPWMEHLIFNCRSQTPEAKESDQQHAKTVEMLQGIASSNTKVPPKNDTDTRLPQDLLNSIASSKISLKSDASKISQQEEPQKEPQRESKGRSQETDGCGTSVKPPGYTATPVQSDHSDIQAGKEEPRRVRKLPHPSSSDTPNQRRGETRDEYRMVRTLSDTNPRSKAKYFPICHLNNINPATDVQKQMVIEEFKTISRTVRKPDLMFRRDPNVPSSVELPKGSERTARKKESTSNDTDRKADSSNMKDSEKAYQMSRSVSNESTQTELMSEYSNTSKTNCAPGQVAKAVSIESVSTVSTDAMSECSKIECVPEEIREAFSKNSRSTDMLPRLSLSLGDESEKVSVTGTHSNSTMNTVVEVKTRSEPAESEDNHDIDEYSMVAKPSRLKKAIQDSRQEKAERSGIQPVVKVKSARTISKVPRIEPTAVNLKEVLENLKPTAMKSKLTPTETESESATNLKRKPMNSKLAAVKSKELLNAKQVSPRIAKLLNRLKKDCEYDRKGAHSSTPVNIDEPKNEESTLNPSLIVSSKQRRSHRQAGRRARREHREAAARKLEQYHMEALHTNSTVSPDESGRSTPTEYEDAREYQYTSDDERENAQAKHTPDMKQLLHEVIDTAVPSSSETSASQGRHVDEVHASTADRLMSNPQHNAYMVPAPQNMVPTPQNMVPTPQHMVPTPQNMVPTPPNMVPTPQNMVPTPTNMVPTPPNIVPTPQNMVPTPPNIIPTPQNMVSTPPNIVPMLEQIRQRPDLKLTPINVQKPDPSVADEENVPTFNAISHETVDRAPVINSQNDRAIDDGYVPATDVSQKRTESVEQVPDTISQNVPTSSDTHMHATTDEPRPQNVRSSYDRHVLATEEQQKKEERLVQVPVTKSQSVPTSGYKHMHATEGPRSLKNVPTSYDRHVLATEEQRKREERLVQVPVTKSQSVRPSSDKHMRITQEPRSQSVPANDDRHMPATEQPQNTDVFADRVPVQNSQSVTTSGDKHAPNEESQNTEEPAYEVSVQHPQNIPERDVKQVSSTEDVSANDDKHMSASEVSQNTEEFAIEVPVQKPHNVPAIDDKHVPATEEPHTTEKYVNEVQHMTVQHSVTTEARSVTSFEEEQDKLMPLRHRLEHHHTVMYEAQLQDTYYQPVRIVGEPVELIFMDDVKHCGRNNDAVTSSLESQVSYSEVTQTPEPSRRRMATQGTRRRSNGVTSPQHSNYSEVSYSDSVGRPNKHPQLPLDEMEDEKADDYDDESSSIFSEAEPFRPGTSFEAAHPSILKCKGDKSGKTKKKSFLSRLFGKKSKKSKSKTKVTFNEDVSKASPSQYSEKIKHLAKTKLQQPLSRYRNGELTPEVMDEISRQNAGCSRVKRNTRPCTSGADYGFEEDDCPDDGYYRQDGSASDTASIEPREIMAAENFQHQIHRQDLFIPHGHLDNDTRRYSRSASKATERRMSMYSESMGSHPSEIQEDETFAELKQKRMKQRSRRSIPFDGSDEESCQAMAAPEVPDNECSHNSQRSKSVVKRLFDKKQNKNKNSKLQY